MIRFLRWVGWMFSLVAIYAVIGLIGGAVALLTAASYAYPNGAFIFFCGALSTVSALHMRRLVRRRARLPGAQPFSQSVRSIITHNWHHREAA